MKVKIIKKSSGPIVVNGDVDLENDKGDKYEVKKVFSLCGCGKSLQMPFCDGSHKI